MIAGFRQRHGKTVVHGWGMTETSPLATASDYVAEFRDANEETQLDVVAMQGLPLPFVELRAIDDEGKEIPWDAEAMGELEVRGPWVAAGYYDTPEQADRWTDGRLVQDRRHRVVPSAGVRDDQGPLEGRDQVGRRVDLVRRPRERPDGAPGDRRGGRDRDPAREVGRAAARGLRAARRTDGATGDELRDVPRSELRQVVAAGRLRVRRRDPEDGGRQVPQDGSAGAVSRAQPVSSSSADPGEDVHRHRRPLRARRGHGVDARARGREGRDRRPAGDGRHRRGGGADARRLGRRAARRGQLRRDRRRRPRGRLSARPLPEGDRGEPDRDVQRALARRREDGRGRARTRRARAA